MLTYLYITSLSFFSELQQLYNVFKR